ncbi:MAG: ATP-binding protein [Marmoricola sp.]
MNRLRRRRSSWGPDGASTRTAVLDATGCVVMVIDPTTGNVVDMNAPTQTMTGYPRAELLDRPLWRTIVEPGERPAMKAAYDASLRAGLPLSYECTIETRSGERRRFAWSGQFLRDEQGLGTHLVVTGIDVSAAQSTSGLFGHLMRAATTTAFVGTDLDGRVTFFSSGAEQMLGYSAQELLGTTFPRRFFESTQFRARAEAMNVPVDLGLLAMPSTRLDRRGRREFDFGAHDRRRPEVRLSAEHRSYVPAQWAHDWAMMHKDGTRLTVSISVDAIRDSFGSQVGYLAVARDITDQRTTEELLFATIEMEREAVDRLRALDEAKTEFVATVSHELRTPMTSITGYTELLHDGAAGDLTPAQTEFVDAIGRNSDRLTALANDLLTLSRLESGTFSHEQEDVDLCEVLWAAHSALSAVTSPRRLDLSFETPPDPVVIHGDARNLERMVSNLVSNAVKFTEDGGWVRCQLRTVEGNASIEVSDSGIGIPEAEQHELFTRFFRASTALERAIQGTGLGLTIVESIARGHGGDISVVSAPLRGATFTVTLPLKKSAETRQRHR